MNNKYLEVYLQTLKSKCTKDTYETSIKQMLEYVGKPEQEISRLDLTMWLNHIKETYSTATEAVKLNAVKGYFNFLYDNEIIDNNVADKLKGDKIVNKPKQALTKEDALKMLEMARSLRDKAIIAMYLSTGLRVQELIDLTLDDYQEETLVIKTKGEKYRSIVLNKDCKAYIDAYLVVRKDGSNNLFTSNRGTALHRNNIGTMLKSLAKKCGIEVNVTNHTFRSTFVTEIAREHGVLMAQQAVGHSRVDTTQRYVRGLEKEVKDIMTSITL